MRVASDIAHKIDSLHNFKAPINWSVTFKVLLFHTLGPWWCYHYAWPAKWQTLAFALVMFTVTILGTTCGVHRYWSHHSYKATRPLEILLVLFSTMSGQISIIHWARTHRQHHKYSDTEADPHDVTRGLFYSHIGWVMLHKTEAVKSKEKLIDFSDLTRDPLLYFQHKYYNALAWPVAIILPTIVGVWLWSETWVCAIAWQCFIRYLVALHSIFAINSLAHSYGYRPYNKKIKPSENWLVSILTLGDGWHNYHHSFPYDYKSMELPDAINLSTNFIRLCAKLGLASDLREPSPEVVQAYMKRMGDSEYIPQVYDTDLKQDGVRDSGGDEGRQVLTRSAGN